MELEEFRTEIKEKMSDYYFKNIMKYVMNDKRGNITLSKEEEAPAYAEQKFPPARADQVSGLMRELMLLAEFGKGSIPGYQRSDKYRGEVVLDDGALKATIDTIYIGSRYWGYVLDAQNSLDTAMKINPATFRLDGTHAI